MHHGEGRRKTGAGGGRKNQLITVPPQGRMSGIKKVLPSGKFRGLATLPGVFFLLPCDWTVVFSPWSSFSVCVTDQSHGSGTGHWKASLVCQQIPWWLMHRAFKGSSTPARAQLVGTFRRLFYFMGSVTLVLQQNCYSPLLTAGLKSRVWSKRK